MNTDFSEYGRGDWLKLLGTLFLSERQTINARLLFIMIAVHWEGTDSPMGQQALGIAEELLEEEMGTDQRKMVCEAIKAAFPNMKISETANVHLSTHKSNGVLLTP